MRLVRFTLLKTAGLARLAVAGLWMAMLFSSSIWLQGCKKEDKPIVLPGNKAVDIELVAENFTSPLGVVEAPDNSNRLFVIDQVGKIWIINASGNTLPTPFLDISNKLVTLRAGYDERGLLGLAFHPSYASNGKFYVFYTAAPPSGGPTTDAGNTGLPKVWNNTTTVSEFRVSSNRNVANLNSERIILQEPHPQANHNGGTIAFGPDGYLYIAIGDGGNKNDLGPGHVEDWYAVNAGGNGQDIEQNLMGNILRLDVNTSSGERAYGIPRDNPFVGKPGRDEIYAYGFRNPYRFSFDISGSRRLLSMDAGQSRNEEISVVEKGGNYGWNVKEGTECFNAANEFSPLASCPRVDALGNPLIDPVIQIKNWLHPDGDGRATTVIAGHFYRGNELHGLQGRYIFGTFSQTPTTPNGELFVARGHGSGLWDFEEIELASHPGDIGYYLKGFGQDVEGEVYLTVSSILGPTGNSGKVFKLVLVKEK